MQQSEGTAPAADKVLVFKNVKFYAAMLNWTIPGLTNNSCKCKYMLVLILIIYSILLGCFIANVCINSSVSSDMSE